MSHLPTIQYTEGILIIQHHFEEVEDSCVSMPFKYPHIAVAPYGEYEFSRYESGVEHPAIYTGGPILYSMPPGVPVKVVCKKLPALFYCFFNLRNEHAVEELMLFGDLDFVSDEAKDYVRSLYGDKYL